MFSDINNENLSRIAAARLDRATQAIAALTVPTRAEFLAAAHSLINRALALGPDPQLVRRVHPEAPAIPGDIWNAFQSLNQDSSDFAGQLEFVEDTVASFYNLSATAQNRLRQAVREAAYRSSPTLWQEAFVNLGQSSSVTSTVDVQSGIMTLPVLSSTRVPLETIALGPSASGTPAGVLADLTTDSDVRAAGVTVTPTVVGGAAAPQAVLDLVLQFSQPVVANRLEATLDNYAGYQLSKLTVSANSVFEQDLTQDLLPDDLLWAADSGKLSGNIVLRFRPYSFTRMRLILTDRANTGSVLLRSLKLWQVHYDNQGTWTSNPITFSAGSVKLEATFYASPVTSPLVSISHQISSDGVNFSAISTAAAVTTSSITPVYYKASLSRNDSLLLQSGQSVLGADPATTAGFPLTSSSTTPIDGQIFQRTLVFSSVAGTIALAEPVIEGTLQAFAAGTVMNPSLYTFDGTYLTFPVTYLNVTITYQTGAGVRPQPSPVTDLYTPLLSLVHLRKAS